MASTPPAPQLPAPDQPSHASSQHPRSRAHAKPHPIPLRELACAIAAIAAITLALIVVGPNLRTGEPLPPNDWALLIPLAITTLCLTIRINRR